MNATEQQEAPGDIEALLPWYAAGSLSRRDAQRVEEALARDPELARRYALVREEMAETIHLNETLGAPSTRAMETLFAKIDAEPKRKAAMSPGLGARLADWVTGLAPRTLVLAASVAVLAVLLQAGFIASVVLKAPQGGYELSTAPARGEFVLIRFAPQAGAEDITKFLESNNFQVVDGPRPGGLYKVRVAETGLPQEARDRLLKRLQSDKIVNFVATTR